MKDNKPETKVSKKDKKAPVAKKAAKPKRELNKE